MISEIDLMEGLRLMLVGMTTVFSFLALLVIAMLATSIFFRKFAHLFPEEVAPAPRATAPAPQTNLDIAVAIAAVKAYTRS
jgi:sodium pump decarboxylase gamma subunit